MSKEKDLGQVFTPTELVRTILNETGVQVDEYASDTTILEPSFGAGVFLYEIIERIIQNGHKNNLNNTKIEQNINHSVHGVEYDEDLFNKTKQELINWVQQTHNLNITLPNLKRMDALDIPQSGTYDYIVGNPPYIRVHNMPAELREKVKQHAHATGTTDLYIIFFELALKWLKPTGKLGYITPNSWLKNTSQHNFRAELINNRLITKIINYGTKKMFPAVNTYTCITILNNERNAQEIEYTEADETTLISYTTLLPKAGQKLIFLNTAKQDELNAYEQGTTQTLKDVCTTQNGLATLGDRYYLIPEDDATEYEPETVLPVVKASRYKGEPITKRMLFPYTYDADLNKLRGLTEAELSQYPNTHQHFLNHEQKLRERSLDRNSLWFWYGRSQAVQQTMKRKLVFSPVIAPNQTRIQAHILPEGTLVYSGLFITEKPDGYTLEEVKGIIESEWFCTYMKNHGKEMNGNYRSVNSVLINAFKI